MDEPSLTPFAMTFMLVSMVSVTVLMVYCFWRILRGGDVAYDTAEALEETVSASVVGVPPRFERASLRYRRDESTGDALPRTTREPDHLVTLNNLGYSADLTGPIEPDPATGISTDETLRPFYGLPDGSGTLYLGFDTELRDGPIHVLFSLEDEAFPEDFYPRVRWEHRVDPRADEWAIVEVEDETRVVVGSLEDYLMEREREEEEEEDE